MRAWIVLLVWLVPAAGLAQDFGARVTPGGLDTLTEVALQRVPSVFSIERLDPVLFDCPGDDVAAHVPPTDVQLNFRELDIRTDDGTIVVSTTLDIDVANTITLDNPYACLGSAICDVSANLDRLGIEIELAAATAPEGGIEFHSATASLDLASEDLAIESTGCAVGEAATWLFDAFEEWALNLLTPRIEAALSERLSGALSDLFSETVNLSIEREGFTIEGTLDSLDLTRLLGVTLGGGASLTWNGEAIYEDPAPEIAAPEGDALPADLAGDFQVAVSDRLVTGALYEAWRGGLMRRLLADQSRSIELAGDGLARTIGLPAGTRLDISFDIERPLAATFGRTAPDVASIEMEQLHVTVNVVPPSGEPSRFDIFASGTLGAAMTMSAEVGGMVMDVRSMELTSVRIDASNESLELGGERLSSFVTGTISPLLGQRLTGLPVAPGLIPVAGTFIHIRTVESSGGWQRVGADLITPDPDDVVPPDTTLVDPATLLPAGTAAFAVSGSDNDTPVELLRYRAWVDGIPLNDGAASGLSTVRFDVTGGEHTLEVAALDLNDNVDGTPVVHVFDVDANPPELTVITAPAGIADGPSITATWTAVDPEGSAVESRWVLRELDEDGMATVVLEEPFGPDTGSLEIATGSLDGSLYELEIVVRDEAGNLASQSFGFAPLGGGSGCAVSAPGSTGSPSGAPAFFGLGLALLFVWRRRSA